MARISYVEKDQTPPEVQQNFARFEKALGHVPNFFGSCVTTVRGVLS